LFAVVDTQLLPWIRTSTTPAEAVRAPQIAAAKINALEI
jgi:hypothetical protein